MQYMGSKAQVVRPIIEYLHASRGCREVVEPFCGGLSITASLTGKRHASDIDAALITLYRRMQAGWLPPDSLSREEYEDLRELDDSENPLTAFAAYGCSFGGKRWGGYAERNSNHWGVEKVVDGWRPHWGWNKEDIRRWVAVAPSSRSAVEPGDPRLVDARVPPHATYAGIARRALLKKLRRCEGVTFQACDYASVAARGALIYADPPYLGTTDYDAPFDHPAFWDWCRVMSQENIVIVSEERAPPDFACVLELAADGRLKGRGERSARQERLFALSPVKAVPAQFSLF